HLVGGRSECLRTYHRHQIRWQTTDLYIDILPEAAARPGPANTTICLAAERASLNSERLITGNEAGGVTANSRDEQ
ncbi:MAG TPA: hypothetical protein VGO47_06150, partial [Chlamydiales bacterium]|nr:hypothetical protein [Chlamydiales bacterium]